MTSEAHHLEPQTFSSSPLNRSILERREDGFIERVLPHAQVLLVTGNQCCVTGADDSASLKWHDLSGLSHLGFESSGGLLVSKRHPESGQLAVIPFLLGRESGVSGWRLAADIGAVQSQLEGLEFRELRSLLACLPIQDLAVAGQAVALSQWHASNPFCSRCGAPNKQIEAGAKVQCTANDRHRAYPRTDPVAIMMVEDVSGGRALLGRPKKLRSGVLTCLSGFVEQGESVEEAVRREVFEEAGIRVGKVEIVGSQPWPIGRGGSCELMIGCIGKALTEDLAMDKDEMEDVRWVARSEVKAAVEAASSNLQFDGKTSKAGGLDFFLPPAWAIAHHLICCWAARDQPWFSKM